MTAAMTDHTAEELPPGEWSRRPAALEEEAHRDGWLQRLGAPPAEHPRLLTAAELRAWDAGHAAAHRSLVCVRRADEPVPELQEPVPDVTPPEAPGSARADAAAAEAVAGLPFLPLPAGPTAPFFDGSQLCAQVDPELFFPQKGGSTAAAKRLCGSCEFLNPCRRYALTAWVAGLPVSGVWGGTSDHDRRRLRRAIATGQLHTEEPPAEVGHDSDEDVA